VTVRLLSAVLAAILVLPGIARAAPATVQVFEAPARSAPGAGAPVVHVFAEGAVVSVSEAGEAGWRRVRLPDGGIAWIEESALWLAAGPAAAVPAPGASPGPGLAAAAAPVHAVAASAAAAPDLRARVYVKDLDHLADLVRADPEVGPQAQRLETRRRAAVATGVVGLGASLGLMVLGVTRMNREFDRALDSPDYRSPGDDGVGLVMSGLAVSAATPLLMWAILPKRTDLLDVVNGWNARHPGEQFDLGRGAMRQQRTR
jgi:hypothetical protein